MANKKISELPITENLRDTDLGVFEQPSSTKAVTIATLRNTLNCFTDDYRLKLEGIEENANNYLHPETHPAEMIEETEEKKFVSQAEKEHWNDKYTIAEMENRLQTFAHSLDWKESVDSYGDIVVTYPEPEDGWTVNVKDTNITYRYDAEAQKWIKISSNSIPTATMDNDGLLSKYDKIKLDSIESNANNYRHPLNHPPEIISETLDKQFVTAEQKVNWTSKETVEGAQDKASTAKKEAKEEAINESKKYADEILAAHNHDNTYSKLEHNHDEAYSKLNHAHAYQEILEAPKVPTKVSDLENDLGFITNMGGSGIPDSKHVHPNMSALNKVSETKIIEWNNKSNFSGHYKDLVGKPVIPPAADVNKLYVDNQLATKSDINHNHDNLYSLFNHTHITREITDLPKIPTKTSELINDAGFITEPGDGSGTCHIHNNFGLLEQITEPMITYLKNPFDGNYTSLKGSPTNVSHFANDAGYVTAEHNHDGRYYRKDETYPKTDIYTKVEIADIIASLQPDGPLKEESGKIITHSFTILEEDLRYSVEEGVYKATLTHNLNTEDIIARIVLGASKDALVDAYKIVDANSIEVYSEVLEVIDVLIFTTNYEHYDKYGDVTANGNIDSYKRTINKEEFFLDEETGLHKASVVHNLDTQNIIARVSDSTTKEIYVDAYKLFDNRSIEVYLKEPIEVDVFIISNGYSITRRDRGEINTYVTIINSSEFVEEMNGLYVYNVYHSLGTENILVSMNDATTGESLVDSYKIVDRNSIQVFIEKKAPVRITIMSDIYKNQFTGSLDLSKFVMKTELQNELLRYVPREAGKGLSSNDFTTELKLKLEGITEYKHPAYHLPSEIATDENNRFVSDKERLKWNKKIDTVDYKNNRLIFKVGDITVKEVEIQSPISKVSELENDLGFVTRDEVGNLGGNHEHENLDALNSITSERINKWDLAGDYNNLINKPKIPVAVSELVNDKNYATVDSVNEKLESIKYTNLSFNKTVLSTEWEDEGGTKFKMATITHNLDSEELIVTAIKTGSKESLFIPFRIIDSNNIKIYNETNDEIIINIICTKVLQMNPSMYRSEDYNLNDLKTRNKDSLVSAINELAEEIKMLRG